MKLLREMANAGAVGVVVQDELGTPYNNDELTKVMRPGHEDMEVWLKGFHWPNLG